MVRFKEVMRIIQVHNYYQQIGGEESVVDAERNLLEANGHEVISYYIHNNGIKGILQLIISSLKTFWNFKTYSDICHLLDKYRPDLVHCHNTFPLISPSIYWACNYKKIPVVQTLHNYRLLCPSANLFFNGKIYESSLGKLFPFKAVKDRVYRDSFFGTLVVALMLFFHRIIGTWNNKVTLYIALTDFQKEKMIEGGLSEDLIMVKPNFISDEKEIVSSDILDIEVNCPVFLFVGRLSPEKGCEVLLRAWKQIKSQTESNSVLLIVGDGPEKDTLEELSDSLSLKEIRFLGLRSREEVQYLMAKSDLLIFPSLWYEGFPMTIVEAFNRGLPVAASDIGSMQSIIVEGINGFKFEPGNVDDLADCIKSVLEKSSELREIRDRMLNMPNPAYRSSGNLKSLMKIYKQAMLRVH